MKKKYMNPYMAGTMLGIVLLAGNVPGRTRSRCKRWSEILCSFNCWCSRSPHADNSIYYSKYFEDGKKPLKNWLTIEILGVVAGGFISGAISKRLKFKIEKSPNISNTRRLDLCISRRSLFCLWSTAGKRMYKRCRSFRNGSSFCCRICDHDCNFRISISVCMVFQEKLDMMKYKGERQVSNKT